MDDDIEEVEYQSTKKLKREREQKEALKDIEKVEYTPSHELRTPPTTAERARGAAEKARGIASGAIHAGGSLMRMMIPPQQGPSQRQPPQRQPAQRRGPPQRAAPQPQRTSQPQNIWNFQNPFEGARRAAPQIHRPQAPPWNPWGNLGQQKQAMPRHRRSKRKHRRGRYKKRKGSRRSDIHIIIKR